MSEAILFRTCLGLNDSKGIASQTMITSPPAKGAGSTELIDCMNLTVSTDGCVEKLAPLVTALDTGAEITALSAGSRLLFSDGISTKEWSGSTVVNRFPTIVGPIAHTNIDCRVSTANKVYRSRNDSPGMSEAIVEPAIIETTKPYYGQPVFSGSFAYNTMLYGVNTEKPKFIQHSSRMEFNFDAWYLGDHGLYHAYAVLQAGSIPGVVLATHAEGVTVWSGSGPHDFVRRFYPCAYLPGSLYSGKVGQTTGGSDGTPVTAIIHKHVFLCADGVYTVDESGALTNITDPRTAHLKDLNSSYSCATVQGDKYLAFGDRCCIEYDFQTKALMKRETFGIGGACVWNNGNYFATGNRIVTLGAESDTSSDFACSLTLPYSDLSASGVKSIEALYFTGTLSGDLTITATDQNEESWEWVESAAPGKVTNFRIKTPKRMLGNHISFKLECSGAFRMEELRAVIAGSKRSR